MEFELGKDKSADLVSLSMDGKDEVTVVIQKNDTSSGEKVSDGGHQTLTLNKEESEEFLSVIDDVLQAAIERSLEEQESEQKAE